MEEKRMKNFVSFPFFLFVLDLDSEAFYASLAQPKEIKWDCGKIL
jgi:hypothetical protein